MVTACSYHSRLTLSWVLAPSTLVQEHRKEEKGRELTCAQHRSQPHLVAGLPILADLLEEPCVVGTEVLEKTRAGVWGRVSPERAVGWGEGKWVTPEREDTQVKQSGASGGRA